MFWKTKVTRSLILCASAGAFMPLATAADLEDWLVTTTMTGGPGPASAGPALEPKHICQAPAGEQTMQDFGAVPPFCTTSKPTRSGETFTFQLSCDPAAMVRDHMKGMSGAGPSPNMQKTTGTVVSRRVDANTIEQTLTYRMSQAPAVTLRTVGKRVGSCKKLTFPKRQ